MLESDLTSSIPGNGNGLTETLLPQPVGCAAPRSPRACGHPDSLTCRVRVLTVFPPLRYEIRALTSTDARGGSAEGQSRLWKRREVEAWAKRWRREKP